jgi:hypothetical protein
MLAVSAVLSAQEQEKKVPKDSVRLTIPGCVNGRTFTVMRREQPEPIDAEVPVGRRFRLNGKKDVLKEMNEQKATMVEVTGLARRSQVQQGGIPIAGGRIRIGGAQPQVPVGGGGARPELYYNEAIFDVESWRSLPDSCPAR